MFGFGKFMTKDVLPRWETGLGPWLLPRDFPPSGRLDYAIWHERWNKAQYAIAESIWAGRPCGEEEMLAISRHVTESDYKPQKSLGFASFIYAMADEFGDGPQMDAKGFLWRLKALLENGADLLAPKDKEKDAPRPEIPDSFLPLAEDFLVTLEAFRPWNVNFKGCRLLENAWKRAGAAWPMEEEWPLRLAMRYLLERNGVLIRWEINAFDEAMLRRFRSESFPSATDFRHILRIAEL